MVSDSTEESDGEWRLANLQARPSLESKSNRATAGTALSTMRDESPRLLFGWPAIPLIPRAVEWTRVHLRHLI